MKVLSFFCASMCFFQFWHGQTCGRLSAFTLASLSSGFAVGLSKNRKPFQFLHVHVLREYLAFEFRQESFAGPLSFQWDLERIIDDFIFLCMLVGNDFLPHLPSLSIREGAIELLMGLYKRELPKIGGYLTCDGDLLLQRVSSCSLYFFVFVFVSIT